MSTLFSRVDFRFTWLREKQVNTRGGLTPLYEKAYPCHVAERAKLANKRFGSQVRLQNRRDEKRMIATCATVNCGISGLIRTLLVVYRFLLNRQGRIAFHVTRFLSAKVAAQQVLTRTLEFSIMSLVAAKELVTFHIISPWAHRYRGPF